MSVIKHLEKSLGKIQRGWKAADSVPQLSAALFADRPSVGLATISTVGLSLHMLAMGNRFGRMELVYIPAAQDVVFESAMMLLSVAERVVAVREMLPRGAVIALGAQAAPGTACHELYVAPPSVFSDELDVCRETEPPTVVAWLFPVFPAEAAFIAQRGGEAFEDLLVAADVDVVDCHRSAVV